MRLVGFRAGGVNRVEWSSLSLPRVRLYDGDPEELLVNVCIGDRWSDPFVGVDFYVTGRLGAWLSGRLYRRRNRKAGGGRG